MQENIAAGLGATAKVSVEAAALNDMRRYISAPQQASDQEG
jgi:hypothetical protein